MQRSLSFFCGVSDTVIRQRFSILTLVNVYIWTVHKGAFWKFLVQSQFTWQSYEYESWSCQIFALKSCLKRTRYLSQNRLSHRFFDVSINTLRNDLLFLFSGQDLIKTYHFALTLSRCICNKIWPCWHVSRWVPNINYSHLGWPINWKTSEAFLMRWTLIIPLCGI